MTPPYAAELRVYVPDFNFDFEALKPRCSRYIMGAEDDHIEAIRADLHELYAEVQRRGQILELLLPDAPGPQLDQAVARARFAHLPLQVLDLAAHLGDPVRQGGVGLAVRGRPRARDPGPPRVIC